jgi:putative oxidoreductase
MRFLFSTKSNAALNHIWLLIYRVTISAFMLTHGIPKLNRLISGNVGEFSDPLGVGHTMSLILTVFGEVVAPVLVILGLGTRFSAIPVAFAMAMAGFVVHSADPFARKELALLFLMGFLTIIVMGGGRYSLDTLLGKRR